MAVFICVMNTQAYVRCHIFNKTARDDSLIELAFNA